MYRRFKINVEEGVTDAAEISTKTAEHLASLPFDETNHMTSSSSNWSDLIDLQYRISWLVATIKKAVQLSLVDQFDLDPFLGEVSCFLPLISISG